MTLRFLARYSSRIFLLRLFLWHQGEDYNKEYISRGLVLQRISKVMWAFLLATVANSDK